MIEPTLDQPLPPGVSPPSPNEPDDEGPEFIGRYRVKKVLGKGGFGLVYLAEDQQLNRHVAIKVPHPHLVRRGQDADAYLAEARTVAGLDHPHIVTVFDVGSTDGFPFFVVSKYIEGTDLRKKLKTSRLPLHETVELVATVADALHFAHKCRLVHRDIKPENILIDNQGKPFVADFGLALNEENYGKNPGLCGTPAYMSPEQANSEGHRVDGRSDIFSLGVVFYELLVGRRPFHADSMIELLEQVVSVEARPPRQMDDRIPKEVERICLKALSKRATERYTTAKDMADDLRYFLASASTVEKFSTPDGVRNEVAVPTPQPGLTPTPSEQPAIKIVPKGLRSFDAHDADFFLELLPGPRDRDGLPDSLRFWKTRLEERDADATFTVGLIYGPSGCGKSSLVKAGLLPRLSDDVIAVYVEATAEETETRLLNGLRKRCSELPADAALKETLAALRRGQGIPVGKKVVIVLDQFEQWLHAKKEEQNTELVQALRQCDGTKVQCVVLVRDDFWLAVSRFLKELEIRLLDGQNSALVDLFDQDHARKVLRAFGQAFGKLPVNLRDKTKNQSEFLTQAVAGLAQEGKVISVRLALFAEMMKGKAWTPASLKAVGGTEGVGVTFLEETFSAATAPPEHRYHQKAARADLKALLPETGSDIKGHMRSYAELLEASGYGNRPKDFDDLLRILDSEIRLITPTDPEGKEEASVSSSQPGQKYYQLTHDYLVHSLREWLTRKQKETRRGRAELLLADRAAVWTARPENRQLPSLRQSLSIRWLTAKKNWTPPQRKMMARAGKYHAMRGMALVALVALLGFAGYEGYGRLQAHALRRSLLDASTNEVPAVVADMSSYRRWIDPLLRDAAVQAEASEDARKQLHVGLALLPVDATQVQYLYERLLDATPQEVPVIRDALTSHKDELLNKLWAVVDKPEKDKESQRLRAASALAKYNAESNQWGKAGGLIVDDLVLENPIHLERWSEALRPVKMWLLPRLTEVFNDQRPEHSAERSLATNLLADYAADNAQVLANLVMEANEKQFARMFPKLQDCGEQGLPVLTGEIDKTLPADLPSSAPERDKLAKRQANAAVALLRLNQPAKVWPLLRHSPDPRVRSYLIDRLYPLGASATAITQRLGEEPDLTIQRALLLSLGEFTEQELTRTAREALLPRVQEIYRSNADPGLHAASEWLLRTWKQETWLKQVNDGLSKDQEKRLEGIKRTIAKDKEKTPPQWYVNGQGQTMIAIPGPVEFLMGSPPTETGRFDSERQHHRRIGRTFAVGAKAVTLADYQRFDPAYGGDIKKWAPTGDCPVLAVMWFSAAEYCNWLSKQEGLPESEWCYEPLHDAKTMPALAASSVGLSGTELGPLLAMCGLFPGRTDPEFKVGMRLAANYLQRTGYRMPTEAEMEYVNRAGAVPSRYYGETEDLLPKYAWYLQNARERSWPVGTLKPNDLGFFDVQGNVFTWCTDAYAVYPSGKDNEAVEDKERSLLADLKSRVLRGGSFLNQASHLRSSTRADYVPTSRVIDLGFRPARTLPP